MARPMRRCRINTAGSPCEMPRRCASLEAFSCHGLSPHEIAVTGDGKHLVVANYGNANLPLGGAPYRVAEPSLTVIELASGKLLYKRRVEASGREVRHVAVQGLDRIAAISVVVGTALDDAALRAQGEGVYEPDLSMMGSDYSYLPSPILGFDATRPDHPTTAIMPSDSALARQGQSILYDPRHDEFLATMATSHCLLVVAGEDGRLKRVIRTDPLGLRYPRGIALHPDGEHYVVSGSWRGLHQFQRGSHRPRPECTRHVVFFDHSHIAVAARPA